MPAADEDIRLQLFEFGHDAADIRHVHGVGFHAEQLQAILGGPVLRAIGYTGGEGGVLVGDDDRFGALSPQAVCNADRV